MTDLIRHILASYALWFALSQGNVPGLRQIREAAVGRWPGLLEFLMCPMCLGFWCSLAIVLAVPGPIPEMLIKALAGAAGVFALEALVSRLEAR